MTPQEIFDKVVVHLYTQKKQAADRGGNCQYRAPGGLKCAVGALITDDEYFHEMDSEDGGNVDNVCSAFPERVPQWMREHQELLSHIQWAHDCERNWRTEGCLRQELLNVARTHGLSSAVLDQQKEFIGVDDEEADEETAADAS